MTANTINKDIQISITLLDTYHAFYCLFEDKLAKLKNTTMLVLSIISIDAPMKDNSNGIIRFNLLLLLT